MGHIKQNLNTSHVNVNPILRVSNPLISQHLNTSHVNVNLSFPQI